MLDRNVQGIVQKTVARAWRPQANPHPAILSRAWVTLIQRSLDDSRSGRWRRASNYSLRREEHGFVTLCAARTSAKTVRQHQSLLRTLSAQWKAGSFGKLDRGWLALLTETDFRQAVANDTASKDCAIAEQENVTVARECAAPCPHDVSEASVVAAPKLPEVDVGVILLSLGAGFDARARAPYE